MWKKKEQPEGEPSMTEAERAMAEQCGDAGGPIGAVDPEEIVAHEACREAEAKLRAEVEEWKGKYLHSLADFQNYQRRSLENEKESRRQGITSVVSQLMGVLDNFDLALRQDPSKANAEQIMQGVGMVKAQLLQALGSLGVNVIDPRPGEAFDPHRHEAVAQVPAEGIEPGRIATCFQVGYALGDRVLRPAKTSVSRSSEAT
jgi:molecular chaperone GrpE